MADAKNIAILVGSVATAGTLGYLYGQGRLRLPNPEDAGYEENPTGYPMSAGEIDKGPHAGKVMYRPKLKGQKQRPRVYIDPNAAESLEDLTEKTVNVRQQKAGQRPRQGAEVPPVKKRAVKPKAKAAKKPAKKKKAPPRVANPGPSTVELIQRLSF